MEKKTEIQKFYKFTSSAIIDTFGIKTVRNCAELSHWLNNDGETVDDFEDKILDLAIGRFVELGRSWNESDRRSGGVKNAPLRRSDHLLALGP